VSELYTSDGKKNTGFGSDVFRHDFTIQGYVQELSPNACRAAPSPFLDASLVT